jgi:hypothetical protein
MLRYFALAISLGMAAPLLNTPALADSVDCSSLCDDLTYDSPDDCERLFDAGYRCSTYVDPFSDSPDGEIPWRTPIGREPVWHVAPGRIVPDASYFGLY